MDYTLYGKLLNYLESSNIPICSSEFTSNVEVVLLIEEEKKDRFHKEVTEITGGKAEVVFHRKEYAYFDEEGNFLKQ
jgi:predicted SAM-dependent methyltransferase